MSDNLSIDEIIKQAESIRQKAVKQAESTKKTIGAQEAPSPEKTVEVPAYDGDEDMKIAEPPIKSTPEKEPVKTYPEITPDEKTKTIDQKTRVIDQKTRVVEQKTQVVPKINGSKKSFFETSDEEPLYTKRPPEMLEKPATIKSKSRFDKTSDLEEIPTIVAVDELEHTRIVFGSEPRQEEKKEYDSDEGDQIVLDGFEDSIGDVERIDEALAEEQLAKRRRDKVDKFRISHEGLDAGKSIVEGVQENEYTSGDEKTVFLEKLFTRKSGASFAIISTFIIALITGLLTRLQSTAYLPSFLLNETVFFSVIAVLYLAALIINSKVLVHGLRFRKGINSDFPVAVVNILVFIHSVLLIFDIDLYIDGGATYALAGMFSLLMSQIGKRQMLRRIIKSFEFITSLDELHTVETIENKVDAAIISRGVLTGEANLKTSIRTDFTTKFLDISTSDEPADNIAKITGSLMLGLSAVLFIASSVFNHSVHAGFNVAVCAAAISAPCISLFCTNSVLINLWRELKENGAMINGFEGAAMTNDTNAIVIEAQDLFGPRSCEIHGIKTFNGAKTDDVILQTAAVIMKTKSPLSSVFDDVIIGKQSILPEVDGVVYEDRLGTSAWIYRKKVLVGTRELLIHHGVQVLNEEFEKRYTRKNRKILYLAVAGKLMAIFVVSYNADPKLKRALRKLEKSGMTILVKSADPFINDSSIAELFALPDGFVRVLSTSNARAFEKYSDMHVEKSPAYVIHNGSALGFVSAMSGAEGLEDTRRILSVLITFGCALAFGVVTLLSFLNGLGQINALNIVLFQFIWCVFIFAVSKLRRAV